MEISKNLEEAARSNLEKITSENKTLDRAPLKSPLWSKLDPKYEMLAKTFLNEIDEDIAARVIEQSKAGDPIWDLLGLQFFLKKISKTEREELIRKLRIGNSIEGLISLNKAAFASYNPNNQWRDNYNGGYSVSE